MNKKQYISPAMNVHRIKLQKMIAESPNKLILDPNETNGVSSEGDLLTRRSSIWDDDEE